MMTDQQKEAIKKLCEKFGVDFLSGAMWASHVFSIRAEAALTSALAVTNKAFGRYCYFATSNNWKKLHKIPMRRRS